MPDKQTLESMRRHSLKVKKVLLIVSICLFTVSLLSLIPLIIMRFQGIDVILIPDLLSVDYYLSELLVDVFVTFLSGGVMTLLFSLLVFGRRANFAQAMLENYDELYAAQSKAWKSMPDASIVDVKPVQEEPKKGKYDDLINEYRKLYEQGLITEEEYKQKRKDLGYE